MMFTTVPSIRLVPILVAAALGLLVTTAAAGSPPDLSRRGAHVLEQPFRQLLGRGIAIHAASGTRLTTVGISRVPVKANHPETPCHAFVVDAGQVEVQVPEGDPPASSVLIRTPHQASFVSLGGTAEVVVADRGTTVVVRRGKALVAAGNDWQVLESGQVLVLSRGRTEARRIVGAPTVSLERALLMAREGETVAAAIHIDPVPGADHYEIELFGDSVRPKVIVPTFLAREPWIPVPSLEPGSYRVRVRAVDAYGVAGKSRTSQPIRVIPFDVPEGAAVDGSTVWLPPGGRVKLVRAEGLEMTYGEVNRYFISAPHDIGLARGNSTVARIRVKGSDDEAQLQLRPRPGAELRVGTRPEGASHRLEIELTLFDAMGLVATATPVHKVVRVDGHEVPLTWHQQGASQRAAISIPPRSAPSKVEVEVEDEVGPLVHKTMEIPAPSTTTGGK